MDLCEISSYCFITPILTPKTLRTEKWWL